MPASDSKKSGKGTGKPAPAGKAGAKRPPAGTASRRTVAARPAAPKKSAPKRAAPERAPKKPPPRPAAKKAAVKEPVPRPAATPPKKAARSKRKLVAPAPATRHDGPDPEGFFVARVRGEEAVRDAPHQLQEPGGWEEEPPQPPLDDEGLGELPWTYGDDLLVALPRDPRTLFVYWDHASATLDASFANLPGAKVELWIHARGADWERVRVVDVALEARGWYVHDLEPGRAYRAELHLIGSDGQDRLLPGPSVATALPPQGPSSVVDDRYVSLPWQVPLPKLMGPGLPGGPFSEEARKLLATLSGWSRFGHSRADGAPAGEQDRPSSPTRPTSPAGPFGGKGT